MTPNFKRTIASLAISSVAALSAPLAAESAAPMDLSESGLAASELVASITETETSAMAAVPSAEIDALATGLPSQDGLVFGQLNVVHGEANILRWDKEFAMIDEATPLANAARSQSAKERSFTLDTVTPDFGEPETLASEFALVQGVTFQPRAPVRQAIGAEFEQTYAFGPTTDAASRLDGDVSTVGRATNVRLRF